MGRPVSGSGFVAEAALETGLVRRRWRIRRGVVLVLVFLTVAHRLAGWGQVVMIYSKGDDKDRQ